MSRKSTCAISSSISFLSSAAIWVHVEVPDANDTLKGAAESRGESASAMRRHIRRSTTRAGLGSRRVSNSGLVATFALIELAKFSTVRSTVGQDFDAKPCNSAQRTAKAKLRITWRQ